MGKVGVADAVKVAIVGGAAGAGERDRVSGSGKPLADAVYRDVCIVRCGRGYPVEGAADAVDVAIIDSAARPYRRDRVWLGSCPFARGRAIIGDAGLERSIV